MFSKNMTGKVRQGPRSAELPSSSPRQMINPSIIRSGAKGLGGSSLRRGRPSWLKFSTRRLTRLAILAAVLSSCANAMFRRAGQGLARHARKASALRHPHGHDTVYTLPQAPEHKTYPYPAEADASSSSMEVERPGRTEVSRRGDGSPRRSSGHADSGRSEFEKLEQVCRQFKKETDKIDARKWMLREEMLHTSEDQETIKYMISDELHRSEFDAEALRQEIMDKFDEEFDSIREQPSWEKGYARFPFYERGSEGKDIEGVVIYWEGEPDLISARADSVIHSHGDCYLKPVWGTAWERSYHEDEDKQTVRRGKDRSMDARSGAIFHLNNDKYLHKVFTKGRKGTITVHFYDYHDMPVRKYDPDTLQRLED